MQTITFEISVQTDVANDRFENEALDVSICVCVKMGQISHGHRHMYLKSKSNETFGVNYNFFY